jgi:hypothetical protein
MAKHTSVIQADPDRLFSIRLTFPVYPSPDNLSQLLENLESRIQSVKTVHLEDPGMLYNVFGRGITDVGYTLFDRESFGERCVEVYSPDAPPAFEYPPATVDGLPGIALVVTDTLSAQQFTAGDDPIPATAEQARGLFLDSAENPYNAMYEWEIGLGTLDAIEPLPKINIAVNNRLFESHEAKKIFKCLKSLAVETGVLDFVGVSTNPYSSKYQPPAPDLEIG